MSLTESSTLFALAATSTLAYVIYVAVYRLLFHPFAKFPGPFWARLIVFPSWWHTRTGDRHVWLYSLQEQYGTEFCYRPDSVVINTPSAYKRIFGPKGNVKKGIYYQVWPRNVHTINTWGSTSIDVHARKRRVLNYAFSEAALREAEVFLHSNIDRRLELMGKSGADGQWTSSLNMCDWINWLVFDILGDLCFGKNFDMKEPGSDLRHIPEVMVSFLNYYVPDVWVWLKPRGLDWLLTVASPKWQDFVAKCLDDRSKVEQEQEMKLKPEGQAVDPKTGKRGYDLDELYAECELLTIAVSDTTSAVLSAVYFYLVRRPEVQDKLVRAIRSTFSDHSELRSGSKLASCKYLTAFLQEALRMTPPVSAEPSRKVIPGGTVIDGHYIPEGLHVSTELYCLSYNDKIFPDPFKFRPERWIVDENGKEGSFAESVALAESGFCAFSTGSRRCVGKNLAWLEMRLVVAKTLWQFELRADTANKLEGGDPNGKLGRRVAD
ncbi:cytochrome P450 [Setomelanomma holmii]|uniref:Cytochrome P450 n=1 Tax=Setomelanomma holmii TaxID=210430 RepID=A0A9P4LGQ5_9PLEO|nr:cytochrome P450 [Setomelanomma holmii]